MAHCGLHTDAVPAPLNPISGTYSCEATAQLCNAALFYLGKNHEVLTLDAAPPSCSCTALKREMT